MSSILLRRKHYIRENFRLYVFDGFIWFEMSWTWFNNRWELSSVCMIVLHKFCGRSSLKIKAWKFIKQFLVASWKKLVFISFWYVSFKSWWCYFGFSMFDKVISHHYWIEWNLNKSCTIMYSVFTSWNYPDSIYEHI